MTVNAHDHRTGYCRMLGHHLGFSYCREGVEGQPCPRILDCWFEHFNVLEFIGRHYPEALQEVRTTPPKAKVATLVEFIQEAQQRAGRS